MVALVEMLQKLPWILFVSFLLASQVVSKKKENKKMKNFAVPPPPIVPPPPPFGFTTHTNATNTNFNTINEKPSDELINDESVMDHIMNVNYDATSESNPPFTYTEHGDVFELFEGDIIKTRDLERTVSDMKVGHDNEGVVNDAINRGLWTNAEIPYTFSSYFSSAGRRVVQQAIAVFNKYTCIKFRTRRSGDRNYVYFMSGGGCSSMIGMQGGRQQISLARGCLITGIAVHEMMHAAGFYHEQSRLDRDRYITINWNNINRLMWYNFQKYRSGQASTLGEPYDKRSVMHYGNYAFSTNRRKTIVSKSNPSEVLGQRKGLSKIDIKQLNKYYKCKNTGGGGGGGMKKDFYAFCYLLPKFCDKDDWVTKNCQKTCCKDKSQYCAYWKEAGMCSNPKHNKWMALNCAKSCGYC